MQNSLRAFRWNRTGLILAVVNLFANLFTLLLSFIDKSIGSRAPIILNPFLWNFPSFLIPVFVHKIYRNDALFYSLMLAGGAVQWYLIGVLFSKSRMGMFKKIFDFSYKRSALEALGFFLAYYFISIVVAFLCGIIEWFLFHGHHLYFIMPGAAWVRSGIITILAILLLKYRKLLNDWAAVAIALFSIAASVSNTFFPYGGIAYLSTQVRDKKGSRVGVAVAILAFILLTGIWIRFDQEIKSAIHNYKLVTQGSVIQVKVLSFEEERNNKDERIVQFRIEWPQQPGFQVEDPTLVEKWPEETPPYKMGDRMPVYFLRYPKKGTKLSFGISSVHDTKLKLYHYIVPNMSAPSFLAAKNQAEATKAGAN